MNQGHVSESEQRDRMNRMYEAVLPIYDLTRRYWLLGREEALKQLATEEWSSLVEIGCGTGRNLRKLQEARPTAQFGGADIADAMLKEAQRQCPWGAFAQGAAESIDIEAILGKKPDRIFLSYCMSMFHEPMAALENARRALAPGGRVVVADFGRMDRWPPLAFRGMRRFLDHYHVFELDHGTLEETAAEYRTGLRGFWAIYSFSALPPH
ncbi:MAG: methyltransferase [Myxococcota bacterium]